MITEIDHIIRSRRSVRAFTNRTVSGEVLLELLETASYAPSGTNTQPWKVYVAIAAKRDEIVRTVTAAVNAVRDNPSLASEYCEMFPYYPHEWVSPYIDRRRANGWGLYGLLGIEKGDKEKMHAQHLRNYCFFDAPVGLFFTVHQSMGDGAKMDVAMFMQNMMLAARARGLDTCAQAAWNPYHRIILPLLDAGSDELLVSAMALGYADTNARVNTFHPPREGVDQFVRWPDMKN